MSDPLSPLERRLLAGEPLTEAELTAAPPPLRERLLGLAALAEGNDLAAVAHLRRSRNGLEVGTADWAVSERLYGLALIRALREVEGTFALERADEALERAGLAPFTLDG